MTIRINYPTGPEPLPELPSLLDGRKFTVEGDAVICPHCLQYPPLFKAKNGPNPCPVCGKVFHVLKRGRFTFLTSKTEIPNAEA